MLRFDNLIDNDTIVFQSQKGYEGWRKAVMEELPHAKYGLKDLKIGDYVEFELHLNNGSATLQGTIEVIDHFGGGCCIGNFPSADILCNRTIFKHRDCQVNCVSFFILSDFLPLPCI